MRSHIDTDPDFGVIPVTFVAIRSSDSEDLGEFTGNMVEANPGRTSSIIQRLCNVHIDEISRYHQISFTRAASPSMM